MRGSRPTLHALVSGVDGEDLRTRGHSENVAASAVALAQAMGLRSDRVFKLRRAGLLHDVDKIAVPREVLEKPAG